MMQDYNLYPDSRLNDPLPEYVFNLSLDDISGPLTAVNETDLYRYGCGRMEVIQV